MTTRHDYHPEYEPAYEQYEPAHLALFGVAAIALLVFAWAFGAFVL
jgi:hypothetical protein